MGLFSADTAIIIGAGASVPFGLPNGLQLMDLAAVVLDSEASVLEKIAERYPFGTVLANKAPITYAIHDELQAGSKIEINMAASILKRTSSWIKKQTYDTIDDLIRNFPDKSKLLKIVITYCLVDSLYKRNTDGEWIISDAALQRKLSTPKDERNWIHSLINLARAEMLDDPNYWSSGERIKIINFNYDNLLEYVIGKLWADSNAINIVQGSPERNAANWRDVFEIVHPHGHLSSLPATIPEREFFQFLRSAAADIAVVREQAELPESIRIQRGRAREICEQATLIYAMGFAFARTNCELLGLGGGGRDGSGFPVASQEIRYLNYSGEFGLRDRVDRLATPPGEASLHAVLGRSVHETKDQAGGKLPIHQALMAGFLGEMPS